MPFLNCWTVGAAIHSHLLTLVLKFKNGILCVTVQKSSVRGHILSPHSRLLAGIWPWVIEILDKYEEKQAWIVSVKYYIYIRPVACLLEPCLMGLFIVSMFCSFGGRSTLVPLLSSWCSVQTSKVLSGIYLCPGHLCSYLEQLFCVFILVLLLTQPFLVKRTFSILESPGHVWTFEYKVKKENNSVGFTWVFNAYQMLVLKMAIPQF